MAKKEVSRFGVVRPETLKERTFRVKEVVEKPSPEKAPSNLIVVGKYIITPEIFEIPEESPNQSGEIRLADAFSEFLKRGNALYGYEFEGEWWECGNPRAYSETNLHFSLKHPEYGPKLKEFLKDEKL